MEVVEVSSEGERVTWGILCDFRPYSAIDLFLAQGQVQTGQSMEITQTCPFAGVFSGIKRICDEHGHELYRNEHLAYHKKFYDCWHNAEDNRHINQMRKIKFGDGQEYSLLEEALADSGSTQSFKNQF